MTSAVLSLFSRFEDFARSHFHFFARLAIFIIYFWFGILKVFEMSPAVPLMEQLFEKTIPFFSFSLFLILFGLFEMIIGCLFLKKGLEKYAIPLLYFHLFTTMLPLVLLSKAMWLYPFVPTMEAQYILKNVAIIALSFGVMGKIKK